MQKRNFLLAGLLASCILLMLPGTARAQTTFISASNSDLSLTSLLNPLNSTAMHTINCDMLDVGLQAGLGGSTGNAKLWAIAYGVEIATDDDSAYVQIGIEGVAFNQVTIPIKGVPQTAYNQYITPNPSLTYGSNAGDPDVALGSYWDGAHNHYYAAVVYGNYYPYFTYNPSTPFGKEYRIYMDVYELDLTSPPTIGVTPVATQVEIENTVEQKYTPHIDLMADGTGLNGNGFSGGSYVPNLDRFVVVYERRYVSSGLLRKELMLAHGTLHDFNTYTSNTMYIDDSVTGPDVACTYDPNTGSSIAYISYRYGDDLIKVGDWSWLNPLGGWLTWPVGAQQAPFGTAFNETPRIASQTLYDYNSGSAGTLWHVVSEAPGTATYGGTTLGQNDIYHGTYGYYGAGGVTQIFMDDFLPFSLSGPYTSIVFLAGGPPPPLPTYVWYNNYSPVITGAGDFLGGGIAPGKDSMSIAFYSTLTKNSLSNTNGDVYAYGLSNYYEQLLMPYRPGQEVHEVNLNDMNNYFYAREATLGIADCSNTGYDLLTAWYDEGSFTLGNIGFKFAGGNYAFKTNTINNIDKPRYYNVFPNPANNILKVQGAFNASYYITDVAGRSIMKGTVDRSNTTINVAILAPGMYLLNIRENGGETKVKFVKQ